MSHPKLSLMQLLILLKIEEAILTNQITAYNMGDNWQAIPVQLDILVGCLRNGSNMVFLRCAVSEENATF